MGDSKITFFKKLAFFPGHFFRFLTYFYIYYTFLHTDALLLSLAFGQEPDPKFTQV